MSPRRVLILATATALVAGSTMAHAQGPPGGRGQRGPGGFGGFGGPGMGGPGMMMGGPGGPGGFGGETSLLSNSAVQKELKLTEKQKTKLTSLQKAWQTKMNQAFQRGRNGGNRNQDRDQARAAFEKQNKQHNDDMLAVLEPTQKTRLTQINLQNQGIFAVANPTTAKSLKLTEDQSSKVKEAMEGMQTAIREAMPFRGGRGRRGGGPDGEGGGPPGGEGGEGGGQQGGQPGEGGGPPGGGDAADNGGGPPGGGGPPDFNSDEFRARMEKMRETMTKARTDAEDKLNSILTDEQKASFEKMKGKAFDLDAMRQAMGGPGGPGGRGDRATRGGGNNNRGNNRNRGTNRGRNQGNQDNGGQGGGEPQSQPE